MPAGYEAGFRRSLVAVSDFKVEDIATGWVAIEPAEGAGVMCPYFLPHRLADASTDLSQPEIWEPIVSYPPYDQKPEVQLPPKAEEHLARLHERDDIGAVVQRLGAAAAQADAASLPAVLMRELPGLFERYPLGSLWYVSVDPRLLARLAFVRVRLQLSLTPDIDYNHAARDGVQYFGMHTTTHGLEFRHTLDQVMLAIPPTALGFNVGVYPHTVAFLFGKYEDLRDHQGGSLGSRFFPSISAEPGVPGMKFPAQGLSAGHWEALLAWWTTRLNVIYSYAADPTNFGSAGLRDAAAQAAWLFTLERMMADAAALLAAVDAPPILRMQAAFDLLDKADSLLTPQGKLAEGKTFKRLLRRGEALPRLERAFERLPVQLRPLFQRWARESYDRLYNDIKLTTMKSRQEQGGVRVALTDPAKPQLMPWDDYVAALMRTARNSSHGLQSILQAPDPKSGKSDPRLLLATNSGEVPYSLYEVAAIAFMGLIADAERLCARTWWS